MFPALDRFACSGEFAMKPLRTKLMWFVLAAFLTLCACYAAHALGIGDCINATPESNADCELVGPCADTYTCLSSSHADCSYVVFNVVRDYGNCVNDYWDYGCVKCGSFACAEGQGYYNMDEYHQCYNDCTSLVRVRYNVCIPTS